MRGTPFKCVLYLVVLLSCLLARGAEPAAVDEGVVYLYLGKAGDLSDSASWESYGGQADAGYGAAVLAADVNADGCADVIVGQPDYDVRVYEERESGCFIATAAYNGESEQVRKWESEKERLPITPRLRSGQADHRSPITDDPLTTLRRFRDEYLLTNKAGRALVRFYYRRSPPVADFIRDKEPLKAIVRVGLRPLVWLVKVTLGPAEPTQE